MFLAARRTGQTGREGKEAGGREVDWRSEEDGGGKERKKRRKSAPLPVD